MTGNSNSGSACIKELYAKYPNACKITAAFRTKEKAQPLVDAFPDLNVIVGIDAGNKESLMESFKGSEAAYIITAHDPKRGFKEDA